MNLKLKNLLDIHIGVDCKVGIRPVVVKRKVVVNEHEQEIRLNNMCEVTNIDEYIGTISYIPDNPLQDIYTLIINIDNSLFFVDAMTVFFKETKGIFNIPYGKKCDFPIHTLLVKDLRFEYKDGVYTYKSL